MQNLTETLEQAIDNKTFIRLILSSPSDRTGDLNKVTVRLVEIKNESELSFLYSYKTKTVTKNYSLEEGIALIGELFGNSFTGCVMFTQENDISFKKTKKGHILFSRLKPSHAGCDFSTEHNLRKTKFISIDNNIYLERLGVVKNGRVLDGMSGKFRQINRFVETISELIETSGLLVKEKLSVLDMGSGKGYLTFAVYDYIANSMKIPAEITGVELREEMVDLCNRIAAECDFTGLKFYKGSINDFSVEKTDILIALHACDTATDDAISKGIRSGAEIIIVSPCCHKQIRKQLKIHNELQEITKHGILEERLAEMATDTMRALFLEAQGYKTHIFEFISDEHTHKNIMITAVKKKKTADISQYIEKIGSLKKFLGIENFYLENLFK